MIRTIWFSNFAYNFGVWFRLVFTPQFSLNILNFATVNGDAPPLRYLSFEEKVKGTYYLVYTLSRKSRGLVDGPPPFPPLFRLIFLIEHIVDVVVHHDKGHHTRK